MGQVKNNSYPRAIFHVDGDAFFASCEVAKNPKLRGLPVVVGGLRGIAVAMTYEAKRRGVTRGMTMKDIRYVCPDAVILPGDYDLYEQIARRMYAIARRYTDVVEEYSVDECFGDLTSTQGAVDSAQHEETERRIKHDLESETGVSFSVGLATTKVLAKVASKHNKPSGLVCIPAGAEREYLKDLSCAKVWGIGPATAGMLYRAGIHTALEFIDQPAVWIQENMAKPHRALWRELRGESLYDVDPESHAEQKSVAATRTFKPPTSDKKFVFSQLSKNIEEACRRARDHGLVARHIYCFIKSQEFQYRRFEVQLLAHTNIPSEVLGAVTPLFEEHFKKGILYRATGVTLSDIRPVAATQQDLFGIEKARDGQHEIYSVVDVLEHKYGKNAVHLASSLTALKHRGTPRTPGFARAGLPYLGEVR